ncbi:efflux RND transporter periplasmic adaptor subunit [Lentisalinibacter salinarum]|uniref:efflux RND transporter periplasmic adaptor subunit n=1 Tax=Lentisalinibacter salinarum TaxID=2992239 RepID=UPI0038648ADF
MASRRNIIIGIVAVLAAVLLYLGFRPQPLPVETGTVSRGPLSVTVTEEGKTRIRERYVITSPVAGFAARIELEEGDAVAAGGPLVAIEPVAPTVLDRRSRAEARARVSAAEAALEAAETRVRAAEAEAELAEAERERIERLYETNAVSRAEYDRVISAARRAAAGLRAAMAEAEVARYELQAARDVLRYSAAEPDGEPPEEVVVRSPIDGSVLDVIHESEGVVAAGEHLVTLGDPSNLEVEVELLSADAVRLAPGMPVRLLRWGGDDALQGEVRVVEPSGFTKISALGVEEQRVIVLVDILSPPGRWARLGDGYRVEAEFVLWSGEDVLQVPSSAAFRRGEQWAVFVVEDEHAVFRPISVGRRGEFRVQVVDGLAEGETIVLYPDDEVEDGRRLKTR